MKQAEPEPDWSPRRGTKDVSPVGSERAAPWRLFALGLLALLAACGKGNAAMEDAVLFSALEGRVVKGGQVVPGAMMIREWDFAENGVRGRDQAITDRDGRFAFTAVIHPYRKPRFLAQEPFVAQLIRVQSGGAEWRVWEATKRDFIAGTEASEQPSGASASAVPLRVTIDLDSTPASRREVFGHTVFTGSN